MKNTDIHQQSVSTISFLAVDAVNKANSGHPGMPMGCADLAYILFHDFLQTTPKDPLWKNRDRFILSAGHGSMLQYALLHLCGFDVTIKDLQNFRQLDSRTPGHPEFGHTEGVEATTGPLGQGLANAVGMALSAKMMQARFSTKEFSPIDHHVYAIVSDGDLMEGISSEAASLAGHLKLSNLIYIYDDNKISIDGSTELAFSEDVQKRFEAFDWFVQKIDGHNHEEIRNAISKAKNQKDKPSIIIAQTHIGHGSPNRQGKSSAHGAPLGETETQATKNALGWPTDKTFLVPNEVYAHFEKRSASVEENRKNWENKFATWSKANPELHDLWKKHLSSAPLDIYPKLIQQSIEMPDATRSISNKVQQKVSELIPNLVGGSADLASSCKTLIKDSSDVSAKDFSGRNIHFGIREHAMGAIANGMALYGSFVPFTSTFLVFSDYMRPAIRLAALSKLKTIFIFTHDSIFVGEDGPTHQPIEQVPSLRLIPNLQVARPCDPFEVAASWQWALDHDGPTSIILSRQNLDAVQTEPHPDILKGGYIVKDTNNPSLVLIATGSEVSLACQVQKEMEKQGRATRVVSIPCLEVFAQQDPTYIEKVLPLDVQKVAIEAAQGDLWYKWVGQDGMVIDLQDFGASAPGEVVAQHVGLHVDTIVECINQAL